MVHPTDGGQHVRARSALLSRLVAGVATAWCVWGVELVVALWLGRAELASVWELQFGVGGLLPAWLLGGAALGAFGGLSVFALERARERAGRWTIALLAAAFGVALGYGVGGGRHLAEPGLRWGFALAIGTVAAGAVWLVAPSAARGLTRARHEEARRYVWTGLCLVALVALELANRFVLVRLYPAFHLGLSVLAVLAACFAAAPWWSQPSAGRNAPAWVVGGVFVVAAALLVPGARSVAGFDNLRLILLGRSPTLSWGVKLAAQLAPPPPSSCASAECGAPLAATSDSPLDWTGRDIVLISVDALRADHLGAYGYSRKTPAIDALAAEGVAFERAYAATPHTSYSITSLMTGKYMRPLLLQGAGEDSDTWAGLLRTYGYRTAAFYPPAIFFIDTARFQHFQESTLDFEYAKVEFAEGERRVRQVQSYLEGARSGPGKNLFLWLHLFGPHEPYEAHPEYDFGPRDVDRYDSEIAAADHTIGEVVRLVRAQSPRAVIVLTADHGEEFGEHGGRYHGTSVYEEQVRVPLIVVAPGSVAPGRVSQPVQTIDVLPTVLGALAVPRPARMRGRDLAPLLAGPAPDDEGLALAETEEQSLLAQGHHRLVCERKIGACRLFDLSTDPGQTRDVAALSRQRFEQLRSRLRDLSASHGEFEARGLRAEGKGWPAPILRGISGEADAAAELAELLDDADVGIRRKAAELLFELAQPDAAAGLRLALTRDEDAEVRRWAALALTRLGEGAPLVYELVHDGDVDFRRLAALALAEAGDRRGEDELIAWWRSAGARTFERSRQLLKALARIRSKDAVPALVQSLGDVRLRPDIAHALAQIGDKDARGPLVFALRKERYQSARGALVSAIVTLGGEEELTVPLIRFLGVPDPLKDGVSFALQADILDHIGGPKSTQLGTLRKLANSGVDVDVVVPGGGNGRGVRLIVRAIVEGAGEGKIYVQKAKPGGRTRSKDSEITFRNLPTIDASAALELTVPGGGPHEVAITLPAEWKARPGHALSLSVFADQRVRVAALVAVPLADELPPPPPEPWKASRGGTPAETD